MKTQEKTTTDPTETVTVTGTKLTADTTLTGGEVCGKLRKPRVRVKGQNMKKQNGMEKSATISPCGRYRYRLTRLWDERKPGALFIMLNPSTADAENDDPTIRRCVGFAKAWDCGSMTVVNLFAFRATRPADLIAGLATQVPADVMGPDNDRHIRGALDDHRGRGDYIVCAWGTWGGHTILRERLKQVVQYLPLADLLCLDTTKNGQPRHPLYCPSYAALGQWEIP